MTSRFRVLGALAPALALSPGCAALQPADAAPGLNGRERHVLTTSYYLRAGEPTPVYTPERFDALFRRATDPTLDGEHSELLSSALVLALASAGDESFAAALARQPQVVRRAVAHYLREHGGLRYPLTEAVLERNA